MPRYKVRLQGTFSARWVEVEARDRVHAASLAQRRTTDLATHIRKVR